MAPHCAQFAAGGLTGGEGACRVMQNINAMSSELSLSLLSLLISAASAVAMATAVAPVSAATVLNFTNQTPGTTANSATASGDGITVTASNPVGGPFPTTGGINSITAGLCAFAQNTTTGRRCAYNTPNADSTTSLTGLNFTFVTPSNKPVYISGFNIGQFTSLSSGTITFGAASPISFTSTGYQSLTSPLLVQANTPISITTSAIDPTPSDGGLFRIQSLTVTDVPGPLSLLGVASAFTYSRKLRKKVNTNSANNSVI